MAPAGHGAVLAEKRRALIGNHEIHAERFLGKLEGLFGLEFRESLIHVDPKGRRIKEEHGHGYESGIYSSKRDEEQAYSFGDSLLHTISFVDDVIQFLDKKLHKHPRWEYVSFSVWCKKTFKHIANDWTGILRSMDRALDADHTVDGNASGHSHLKGFHRTPGGKLCINAGSSTDHVQFAVHDKFGNWGVIEYHKDRMVVEMEDGHIYEDYWKDLGLDHFGDEPRMVETEFTQKVDRLCRLMFRVWPARDRQNLPEKIGKLEKGLERLWPVTWVPLSQPPQDRAPSDRLATTLSNGAENSFARIEQTPPVLFWTMHHVAGKLATLEELQTHNPYPRHRPVKKAQKLTLVA